MASSSDKPLLERLKERKLVQRALGFVTESRFFLQVLTVALVPAQSALAQTLYFPPTSGAWESVDPEVVGWDGDRISAALGIAEERGSSALVILHDGRILAERYWEVEDPPGPYVETLQGQDTHGGPIEGVASVQKSVVAVLIGVARERGFLRLDDPVSSHLGSGWAQTTPDREQAVTVRHLLSMSSGLSLDLDFEAQAGSKWLYNTPAYERLIEVVEAATGLDHQTLTREWLTGPLGMESSSWRPRQSTARGPSFDTTARDLARFGLLIQAGGRWAREVVLEDGEYLSAMTSPSQSLNPAYGYLWWLNGQEFRLGTDVGATRRDGPLIPSAPDDLVRAQGQGDRKVYVVPSLGIVITRLGIPGGADGASFDNAFWQALMGTDVP